MADEPEDIKPQLDERCLKEQCQYHVDEYEKCLERIKDVPQEKEPHCYGWYFNVVECVDHCADHELWASLK